MRRRRAKFSATPAVFSIPPSITPRNATLGWAAVGPTAATTQTVMPMRAKPAPVAFLPAGDSAIRSPLLPETVGKPFRASARNCPIRSEGAIRRDGGARPRPVLRALAIAPLAAVNDRAEHQQSTTEQRQRCGLRY